MDDPMLPANDNGYPPNLQIAVWKMLRAGVPSQVIFSTFGLSACDLVRLQTTKNKGSELAVDSTLD